MHSPSAGERAERGSVTAELAVALPAVVLVLAACLGALQLGTMQLRLQDAAATAARALSRGEAPPALADTSFTTWSEGDLRCVRASRERALLIPVSAESCALG